MKTLNYSLDSKQQCKAEILTRLLAASLTTQEAAAHLGVTPRQARRLQSRYRSQGMASVPHGNQGRAPANRTASELVSRITALAGPGGCLHDFNTCHLQERLAAQHLTIGRSTLDRLLKEQGPRKPRKERPQSVRGRRERRAAEGMLLQIDASAHDWLQGRGPRLCLIGAIDDASNRVCYARLHFHSSENQIAYLLMLRTIATERGLPMSFYHDEHTILFWRPAADPEAAWVALPAGIDLAYYFAVKEERTAKADQTLSFQGQCLQIRRTPGAAGLWGKRVRVHVVAEGDVYLYHGKEQLDHTRVQAPVAKGKPEPVTAVAPTPRCKAGARQRAWLYGSG